MKISGLGRLKPTIKRIQKRLASNGLILMYHRVAEVDLDPWGLCVTPQHFAEHLQVLQKYAQPISLRELAQAHQEGKIPRRAVAVTFDDGYVDNLLHAKPLLEQYNIPATIFVTTGYIGQNREFWHDELEQILLQPGRLADKLCLKINGSIHQWELGEAAYYSDEDYQSDRSRKAWEGQAGSRLALYLSIYERLEPLPEDQRQEALNQIQIWAGLERNVRPTYRPLELGELRKLGQGKLIEIGAHTVNHPLLSAHPTALQQDEIQNSKAYLEAVLSRSVTSFAYPFGDYTLETVDLVREAGFDCACSVVEDIVWRKSNRFELPRFGVNDWNGEEFAKQLLRWFHDGKD